MSTGDGARDEDPPALATSWGAYRKWTIMLAGLAVVFVVLVGYDLISGGVLTPARPRRPRRRRRPRRPRHGQPLPPARRLPRLRRRQPWPPVRR